MIFFKGNLCQRCGGNERYRVNGSCVRCSREYGRKYRKGYRVEKKPRWATVDDNVVRVDFGNDLELVLDIEDYQRCSQFYWSAFWNGSRWYVAAKIERRNVYIHRFILDAPDGVVVDHINGNGLDNRRCNLRLCHNWQNSHNARRKISKSGYKGVYWHHEGDKPWQAQIMVNRRKVNLGYFSTPEEAAQAYDRAAKELVEEFATTNFGDGA